MSSVVPCEVPDSTLLAGCATAGAYVDCYSTTVVFQASQSQFVEAFYTSWLFKVERLLLRVVLSRGATDAQALQLATGETAAFAAWSVEDRRPDQLLLADFTGRTKSWLMTRPAQTGTRLFFGSAVVPRRASRAPGSGLGFAFSALLGFHKVYSHLLLQAASRRLEKLNTAGSGGG